MEVMVSIAVFALVAGGIATTTMMTSRIAYENIYENTAYMVVQAYAEQIKSISFARIEAALENPGLYDIPTETLHLGEDISGEDLKKADPLIFGVPLEKEIVVDLDRDAGGGENARTMRLWILPTGRDLGVDTSCWDSIEVTLDFEWEVVAGGMKHINEGAIRLVKTNVSEY